MNEMPDKAPLYKLKDGDGTVSVSGRTPRKDAHTYYIPVPANVKTDLDSLIEGGAVSGAALGMVAHGMDVLDEMHQQLVVERDAESNLYYLIQDGHGIVSDKRSPREGCHALLLPVPGEIKARLDKLIACGSAANAILGLICLSRDVLQKEKKRMLVQRSH